jgi:phosphopentomutase
LRTGNLIVYTSADSVFQIAAHEAILPPTELWHICRIARRLLTGAHAVGRVIARPFTGNPGQFVRTGNRRDFSLDPTGNTLLDAVKGAGFSTIGVGKIEDIFNHRGLTESNHAVGNDACMDALCDYLKKPNWRGLLMANLVDTDMLYGHRNDPIGYGKALEAIDKRVPEFMRLLGDNGLLILTADHGCDPVHPSTDHTREYTPLLVWSLAAREGVDLGTRKSFADVSATVLQALGVKAKLKGTSFWNQIAL